MTAILPKVWIATMCITPVISLHTVVTMHGSLYTVTHQVFQRSQAVVRQEAGPQAVAVGLLHLFSNVQEYMHMQRSKQIRSHGHSHKYTCTCVTKSTLYLRINTTPLKTDWSPIWEVSQSGHVAPLHINLSQIVTPGATQVINISLYSPWKLHVYRYTITNC